MSSPETALITAFFTLGIRDTAAGHKALCRMRRKNPEADIGDMKNMDQRSGMRWMISDSDRPFSFIWCCDVFGTDPGVTRAKVAEKFGDLGANDD